jgi:hypothetical protein
MSRIRRVALCLLMTACVAGHAGAEELGSSAMRGSGFFDTWSLFGAPGRIGWIPDVGDAAAPPATLAGLAFGSVRVVENTHPSDRPWPGLVAVRTPIAWFDTVSTAVGGEGAWQGFEAGLATVTADPLGTVAVPDPTDRAVGMFSFVRGSSAEEQTSISIARIDSLLPLRIDALSVKRGAIGSIEQSGRHLWGGSAGLQLGAHRFGASIAQRGSGTALPSGEDESGTALTGDGSWTWQRARDRMVLSVARGYHHLESAGNTLAPSRRDADQLAADFDWSFDHASGSRGVRLAWRSDEVDRMTVGEAGVHSSEDAAWVAVREQRALAGGSLTAALGGGWSRALDQTSWAPSVAWSTQAGGFAVRAVGERIVTPVWSDLAPGAEPFLQKTWVGGIDLGRHGSGWAASLGGRAGVTDDRALVGRDAIEDLWLRRGVARDPESYAFQMVTGSLAAHGRWLSAGAEGFALGRPTAVAQPNIDPGYGGRGFVQTGFRVFANDLGVTIRIEGAGIGPRQSEATPSRTLPSFATVDAVISATLADAIATFTMRNLADQAQREVWIDPRTGVEALGPGREMRFALTWRLFN